jgi:hypothetical protein
MNTPESQPDLLSAQPAPDPFAAIEGLKQQTQKLNTLLRVTLIALVVMSLGVNGFLFKQVRMLHRQLAQERPLINRMWAEFQKQDPMFRAFAAKLQNYGYTHREFLPILDRYRTALEPFLVTMPPLPSSPMAPSGAPGGAPGVPRPGK